jgi:hypothetical protein
MKCERAHDFVLLAESSELGRRESHRLAEHLAGCESCREFSRGYVRIRQVAGELPAVTGPTPETMAAIRAEVLRTAGCGRRVLFAPATGALALAAGLVVAVAAVWIAVLSDGAIDRVKAAHSAVAVLTDGTFAMSEPAADHAGALRALAADILALEGLSAEPSVGVEIFTSLEEQTPTDPLSHSRILSAAGICG